MSATSAEWFHERDKLRARSAKASREAEHENDAATGGGASTDRVTLADILKSHAAQFAPTTSAAPSKSATRPNSAPAARASHLVERQDISVRTILRSACSGRRERHEGDAQQHSRGAVSATAALVHIDRGDDGEFADAVGLPEQVQDPLAEEVKQLQKKAAVPSCAENVGALQEQRRAEAIMKRRRIANVAAQARLMLQEQEAAKLRSAAGKQRAIYSENLATASQNAAVSAANPPSKQPKVAEALPKFTAMHGELAPHNIKVTVPLKKSKEWYARERLRKLREHDSGAAVSTKEADALLRDSEGAYNTSAQDAASASGVRRSNSISAIYRPGAARVGAKSAQTAQRNTLSRQSTLRTSTSANSTTQRQGSISQSSSLAPDAKSRSGDARSYPETSQSRRPC